MDVLSAKPSVVVIATLDTKAEEAVWIAEQIRRQGLAATLVDVSLGQSPPVGEADVSRDSVLLAAGISPDRLSADRGEAVIQMSQGLGELLLERYSQGSVLGVIGLGGSGGTSLIAAALRRLPIGLPKLIVSTVASGNTGSYIDCSDLVLFPSVVDVAGLNLVSMTILQNAANALCGMVEHRQRLSTQRPLLGLTMFGVTTTCVMAVKRALEQRGWECLIFHAVGTGGRSMERLVESGQIVGVLDLTTTEVADMLAGGIFPAAEDRFDVFSRIAVPLLVSFGALDMVNFGPMSSVPPNYQGRKLFSHNPQITLMRTTPAENAAAGDWIAKKLNRTLGPLKVLVPGGGVSALDAPGKPFWDCEADQALFSAFEGRFEHPARLRQLANHINDPEFAETVVDEFLELVGQP